jgi:hypothetical protein
MSQRHPFVRLTSTSLRPDLPGGRAPNASVVPRMPHRRGTGVSRRAASLTMRARCYELRWSARIHQKTSGSRACKRNSRCLTAGRKSNAITASKSGVQFSWIEFQVSFLSPFYIKYHEGQYNDYNLVTYGHPLAPPVIVLKFYPTLSQNLSEIRI